MEFRILGSLEVVGPEGVVSLGGPRQRALLCLLLIHRNHAVTVDRLADDLWGERLPDSAVKTVQVFVSRLRSALGEGRIVTHGHSYLLRVEDGELDLDRFVALVDRARTEVPTEAVRTLQEALALFRGEPLGDLAAELWAQAEVARLEALRLVALEQRVDAELELGQHRALVPELERLAVEHPLRERFRGQLMLALYRSGRQADALESYQQTRRKLTDELGLEPSDDLKQLQRAILAHDGSLELATSRHEEIPSSDRVPGAGGPARSSVASSSWRHSAPASTRRSAAKAACSSSAASPASARAAWPTRWSPLARERGVRGAGGALLGGRGRARLLAVDPGAARATFAGATGMLRAAARPGRGRLAQVLPELRELWPELPVPPPS